MPLNHPSYHELTAAVEQLQIALDSSDNCDNLTKLEIEVLSALRQYFNAYIMVNTGLFELHHSNSSEGLMETGHELGHLLSHFLHEIPGVTTAIESSSLLTTIGANAAYFCFPHPEKKSVTVGKLGAYSEEERTEIYQHVITHTMMHFYDDIGRHPTEYWNMKIFSNIASSVPEYHECETIYDVAKKWGENSVRNITKSLSSDNSSNKISPKLLCRMAASGDLDGIKKADVSSQTINMITCDAFMGGPTCYLGKYNALMIAAAYRKFDVVKYFIEEKYADLNLKGGRNKDCTVLDCAKQEWWIGPSLDQKIVSYLEEKINERRTLHSLAFSSLPRKLGLFKLPADHSSSQDSPSYSQSFGISSGQATY